MAALSSILAWRIPWTEEPGGLQSMRSRRVGHDRVTQHSTAATRKALYERSFLIPPYNLRFSKGQEEGEKLHF